MPGILGGLALTVLLHGLASLVIAVSAIWIRDAAFILAAFWTFLGIAQWVYIVPAALFARARGWRGVAKGLWIGAGLGVVFTILVLGLKAAGVLN